jgi:NADPH-dependent curcumin reductase CurA
MLQSCSKIVFRDDEARLCSCLGYAIPDLIYMSYFLAVFGGPRDLKLEPGNTIVISLATGGYSDSGVRIALAMGVRVIGAGRDKDKVRRMRRSIR